MTRQSSDECPTTPDIHGTHVLQDTDLDQEFILFNPPPLDSTKEEEMQGGEEKETILCSHHRR